MYISIEYNMYILCIYIYMHVIYILIIIIKLIIKLDESVFKKQK